MDLSRSAGCLLVASCDQGAVNPSNCPISAHCSSRQAGPGRCESLLLEHQDVPKPVVPLSMATLQDQHCSSVHQSTIDTHGSNTEDC